MTRILSFALLTAGVVSASAARAQLPVAPPPREVRPDGARDPVPAPEAVKKENPLDVVERIIKNSKDVGDKLARTDTGPGTREKQKSILKDIDALLNQDDPPPKSDMNQDQDKNKNKNKDKQQGDDSNQDKKQDQNPDKKPNDKSDPGDKKQDMMPNGGMGDPPPKGGMGGMDEQPMGGDEPRERRPRQGGDQKQDAQPKDPGNKGGSGDKQKEQKQPKGGSSKEPKNPGGGKAPDAKGGMPPPNRLLPNEDDGVKDPWGHLPDKLRQQATQYYQDEFMPRYAELLKLYYASLSEKK